MADAINGKRPTSVFISYSRKDKLFVKKLNDALDASGINAWVDWEGIPLSSDWMAEITRAIEGADAFLFTISPDSLASKICAQELELGIKLNKKIVPILYRDPPKGGEMHPRLGSTNWVYMRTKKDDFKATVPKLIESIQTDLGWIQQHTRLLQRATEWDQKNRNNSYLLQGSDLEDGEKWMTESTADTGRNVVPLQAEYISASRKNAINRQRSLMTGIALAFVVSVMLGIYAFFQRGVAVEKEAQAKSSEMTAIANEHLAATQKAIAEDNADLAVKNADLALERENEAKSQRSAAQAKIYEERPGEMDISTLLALDSWVRLPSDQAEDILRHNISFMPVPVAQMEQTGRIWNIHPSIDGEFVVTSSEDGTACVWGMQDGSRKYCVEHEGGVQDAFFNADNNLLITAGSDGAIRFWNGVDGTNAKTFNFDSKVWDIDISPDNRWLAAGRADGKITLIDLNKQKEEVSFNLNSGEIYSVDIDPSSKWLAIGTSQGNITLWRINTEVSFSGPQHKAEVYATAFSADGEWLVSVGGDSTARVTKTISGGQRHSLLHGDWVEDVAFGPDASWFVTVSDDNLVHVWNTETGLEKMRMEHNGFVQRVEVSSDGQWIASTGFDKTVRIWDAASGSLMKEIPLNGIGAALAFSPDGTRVIAGDRDGNVGIWDISELKARVGYIEFPEFVHKAKYNTTGEWVLFNSDDKNLWKLSSDQLTTAHSGLAGTKVLTLNNISGQFKISADSKWVVVSETYGSRAQLYNLETNISRPLPLKADVTGLAFSPDSKQVAITYENGQSVLVWDVETGEQLEEFSFEAVPFTSSYSPKDFTLAIGFTGKTVLWDAVGKKEIATLNQLGDIRSLNFSKDGNWLATSSSEGSIYLWDMKNGDFEQPTYRFQQGGDITSLDFSYNNKWLASAGTNGFAYIWDLTTGGEIARMSHRNSVTGVSFSADDSQLLTVSRKVVQVWDVAALNPIKREKIDTIACSRLTDNMTESMWKFFFNDEPYQQICPNLPVGK